jgi:hypothetical protein
MSRSSDVKTPLARLAYANGLFKPLERDNGSKQWGCTLLFPKTQDLSALAAAVKEAATQEWGDKAVEMLKNEVIKTPFLDGDGKQGRSKETGQPHAGFSGSTFIRVTSGEEYRPKLFDRNVNPTNSQEDIYSGAYVYAVVSAYTWDTKENGKGVSFGVSLIQKAKDGDRLGGGGGPDPSKFLEKIADEGEAPASTKTGAGAAGMFG